MPKEINLRKNKVQQSKQQVSTYGTQTPLSSTAVERGSTRWLNGSTVVIEGLLSVSGTATVSGVLSVTGTFNGSGTNNLDGTNNLSGDNNLTGPTEISGSLDVTGPTNLDGVLTINGDTTITGLLAVDGPTTISGTLDIEGATTVAADFEIIAGGLFKSGVTKIEPTGKATFGDVIIDPESIYLIKTPGGYISGTGADDITLASSSTSSVSLNNSRAELSYGSTVKVTADSTKAELRFGTSLVKARAGAIDLTASKTWVSGEMQINGIARFQAVQVFAPNLPTTANPPNLHLTSNGQFYRSTWTP